MASRKDIDKEKMFNKIMPSSMKASGKPAATIAPTEASPQWTEPAPTVAPIAAAPPAKPKAGLFSTEGVQFKEKRQVVLVNTMEKLVAEKLDAAFEKFNCCKCDRCKMDVAAIALNKLNPRYQVLDPDSPPEIIPPQVSTEVTTAIVQAILVVRSHPRH